MRNYRKERKTTNLSKHSALFWGVYGPPRTASVCIFILETPHRVRPPEKYEARL